MAECFISPQGLKKLEKELENLKEEKKEITKRIGETKAQGDLSENAEYSEAKDAQAFNEGRIAQVEDKLKNCSVTIKNASRNRVGIGSTVSATKDGKKYTFTIVGLEESNPSENFISNESPLGSAFLNKKVGDMAEAETPGGIIKYKIVEIK